MKKQKINKSRKFTFNAIDALIILLILAVLAVVVYVFILGNNLSDIGAEEKAVEYSVKIPDADKSIANSIKISDAVYHAKNDKNVGKVIDLRSEGGYLYITISVIAKKKDNIYSVNGERLINGEQIEISFSQYTPASLVECLGVTRVA